MPEDENEVMDKQSSPAIGQEDSSGSENIEMERLSSEAPLLQPIDVDLQELEDSILIAKQEYENAHKPKKTPGEAVTAKMAGARKSLKKMGSYLGGKDKEESSPSDSNGKLHPKRSLGASFRRAFTVPTLSHTKKNAGNFQWKFENIFSKDFKDRKKAKKDRFLLLQKMLDSVQPGDSRPDIYFVKDDQDVGSDCQRAALMKLSNKGLGKKMGLGMGYSITVRYDVEDAYCVEQLFYDPRKIHVSEIAAQLHHERKFASKQTNPMASTDGQDEAPTTRARAASLPSLNFMHHQLEQMRFSFKRMGSAGATMENEKVGATTENEKSKHINNDDRRSTAESINPPEITS